MTTDGPSAFDYFQRIESHFLLHRGAPLLLSPSDYQVARRWHRDGVPLDLVLRTMDEYFERRAERSRMATDGEGAEPGKVWGLRQVKPSVEAAWKGLRELTATGDRTAPDAAPALDVAGRVAALRAALAEALETALPEDEATRERVVAGLDGLEAEADPRRVEERLAAVEDEALEALLAALAPDERAALESQVDEVLAPLADRMARDEVASTRERLLRQKVRRRAGMPVLTLFGDL